MPESNPSTPSATPDFRRCRCLTVKGVPCHNRAALGHDLCFNHQHNRFPVCPSGPAFPVPLLEDFPSIQVFATQVVQGVLSGAVEPARGNTILYGCQIAALTLARPGRLEPPKQQPAPEEPVTETFTGPNGEPLGPALPWNGPDAVFEPSWSMDKYRYDLECERLKIPKPAGPADMPVAGWLTPEEIEERQDDFLGVEQKRSFKERTLQLRIEADRRGALPPLTERKQCSYNNENYCGGAGSHRNHQCEYCQRERDENDRLPKDSLPAPAAEPAAPAPAPALAPAPAHPQPAQPQPVHPQPDPPVPATLPRLQAAAAHPRIRPAKRNPSPPVNFDNITKSLILKGRPAPPTAVGAPPGRLPATESCTARPS